MQNVRGQMVASPQSGVFNPLRKRKKEEALKGPASKKADNVNSKGNQTLQGGQGTAPGNSRTQNP